MGRAPSCSWSRTEIRTTVLERSGKPSSLHEFFWTLGKSSPEAVSAQWASALGVPERQRLRSRPQVLEILSCLGPTLLPPRQPPPLFILKAEALLVLRPRAFPCILDNKRNRNADSNEVHRASRWLSPVSVWKRQEARSALPWGRQAPSLRLALGMRWRAVLR